MHLYNLLFWLALAAWWIAMIYRENNRLAESVIEREWFMASFHGVFIAMFAILACWAGSHLDAELAAVSAIIRGAP